MSHQLLNRDNVAARLKKSGGVGVAEFVEGGIFDAGALCYLIKADLISSRSYSLVVQVQKKEQAE